jgi:hypothetical protein
MPARHTITLYDLIAAIQDLVEDDALVVATVVHLLQSRRYTGCSASMTATEHAPNGRTCETGAKPYKL